MKVIVAGGRNFNDYALMTERLNYLLSNQSEIIIVSGLAKGADSLALRYAKEKGYPVISCPANWDKYGKSAGYRRNEEMANIADALVAFWDGQSRGTKHMIDIMTRLEKIVRIINY